MSAPSLGLALIERDEEGEHDRVPVFEKPRQKRIPRFMRAREMAGVVVEKHPDGTADWVLPEEVRAVRVPRG